MFLAFETLIVGSTLINVGGLIAGIGAILIGILAALLIALFAKKAIAFFRNKSRKNAKEYSEKYHSRSRSKDDPEYVYDINKGDVDLDSKKVIEQITPTEPYSSYSDVGFYNNSSDFNNKSRKNEKTQDLSKDSKEYEYDINNEDIYVNSKEVGQQIKSTSKDEYYYYDDIENNAYSYSVSNNENADGSNVGDYYYYDPENDVSYKKSQESSTRGSRSTREEEESTNTQHSSQRKTKNILQNKFQKEEHTENNEVPQQPQNISQNGTLEEDIKNNTPKNENIAEKFDYMLCSTGDLLNRTKQAVSGIKESNTDVLQNVIEKQKTGINNSSSPSRTTNTSIKLSLGTADCKEISGNNGGTEHTFFYGKTNITANKKEVTIKELYEGDTLIKRDKIEKELEH